MANSHIDIYPCTMTEYSYTTHACGSPHDGSCALLDLEQEDGSRSCARSQLTPAGYAVAVVVIGLVPLALAALAGFLARKKPAKA